MLARFQYMRYKLSPPYCEHRCWVDDRGDKTLRLKYDLNESSIVFDLEGYEGQWASDIYSMYGCTIHIFEPVRKFSEAITERFARNKKIEVHSLGLASHNAQVNVAATADGSSAYRKGSENAECMLVEALAFFRDHDVQQIDLMKINIEGGEYDLLEHLIAWDWTQNICDIQVQFHDISPDADARMRKIQSQQSQIHSLNQYWFVWEK